MHKVAWTLSVMKRFIWSDSLEQQDVFLVECGGQQRTECHGLTQQRLLLNPVLPGDFVLKWFKDTPGLNTLISQKVLCPLTSLNSFCIQNCFCYCNILCQRHDFGFKHCLMVYFIEVICWIFLNMGSSTRVHGDFGGSDHRRGGRGAIMNATHSILWPPPTWMVLWTTACNA